ncbi:MAG: DUF1579 family protein [Acidobacteriota bacterium]
MVATARLSRILFLGLTWIATSALAQDAVATSQESTSSTSTASSDAPGAGPMTMAQAMTPGDPHAYLAEQVGTWKLTILVWMHPDGQPLESHGTAERRMILDGRVLHEVFRSEVLGRPFDAVGHIGYDNVTGRYWTTFFDNWSTGLTTLNGSLDPSTGKGTLLGETPLAQAGDMVPMRMELYPDDDGRQVVDSYMPMPEHGDMLTMRVVYERP